MSRPLAFYPLCLIFAFLSLGALYGGGALIIDPNGVLIGLPSGSWERIPFGDLLVPGVILFFLNGVFPILILLGLILKPAWNWANALNLYTGRHWAWAYSLYSGIILIAWIAIQLLYVQPFILQPLFIAVGLLILILTLTPGMMRYYEQ
jgi:hypothetical protein